MRWLLVVLLVSALGCGFTAGGTFFSLGAAVGPVSASREAESEAVEHAGWYVDGSPAPPAEWRGHDGPFLALLHITDDAEALYEFWNTQQGNVPAQEVSAVPAGTNVEAVVFFSRCEPDAQGNCQVWAQATVKNERGELVGSTRLPLWTGRPPPPGAALGISEHGVGLIAEASAGSYLFLLEVQDTVGGRAVPLRRELHVRAEK